MTKLPAEVFPEYFLIRVNEFDKAAVTPLEEWIEYLKTGRIRPDTVAPGLAEARQKLIYYNMTAEERHAYDEHLNAIMIQNDVLDGAKLEGLQEGRAEGRAEVRAKGLQEGKKLNQIEVARNLKKMGLSTEMIVQGTGLSVEEIENL